MKQKIPIGDAKKISRKIKKEFKKKGISLIEVGSVARKSKFVSDIDFITSSDLGDDKKYVKFQYPLKKGHVQVDIWKVNKENLKLSKDVRSYPSYYIIEIRKKIKPLGYHLSDQEIFKGDKKIKYQGFQWLTDLAGIVYHPLLYYHE